MCSTEATPATPAVPSVSAAVARRIRTEMLAQWMAIADAMDRLLSDLEECPEGVFDADVKDDARSVLDHCWHGMTNERPLFPQLPVRRRREAGR